MYRKNNKLQPAAENFSCLPNDEQLQRAERTVNCAPLRVAPARSHRAGQATVTLNKIPLFKFTKFPLLEFFIEFKKIVFRNKVETIRQDWSRDLVRDVEIVLESVAKFPPDQVKP